MQSLGATQQSIPLGGSIIFCAGPTDFSERFYFANVVFGIAKNFSLIINHNKRRISEERQPGK